MTFNCLACGGRLGDILFSISDLPLVDSFCKTIEEALAVECFTVELRQCDKCLTVQIASPPDTSNIYRNYIYESASSPDLLDHFSSYSETISDIAPCSSTKILEIGANDGMLLGKLAAAGFTYILGIDPSPQTAKINIKGVEIINEFFNEASVSDLELNSFGVIIANNCFSHIPDLSNILELCSKLLVDSGTIVIEVQSCLDLVQGVVFDYIYHEHIFYHTATSFQRLAALSGLELYQIDHVSTKGGSYRFLIGHASHHPIDSSVSYWIFREVLAGIHSNTAWKLMTNYLADIKTILQRCIHDRNCSLVGYGASATGTVLMRYMDIESTINSIVDDNSKRQGLFAPGTAIPVKAPSILSGEDMCLVLAWRHLKYIVPKLVELSIPYIIPLPSIKING